MFPITPTWIQALSTVQHRIRSLDPSLVNKIAAGEVIERPASVVKELVENALDAGASRIDVALEGGGGELIRVTDNGRGIPRADLPLAVAPHATSKIASADDLFNIGTLGFRGEALASIASVSHLRIVSRPADQIEGYEIIVAEESSAHAGPSNVDTALQATNSVQSSARLNACAAPQGTTVEVRNLFYNVPARRKFLKQPQTECSHVTEQIARLSLAHPRVSFSLTHHGRTLRSLPSTDDRRVRIADFYGAELADCLIPIRGDERGLMIEGLIAPPAHSRASTKWQYLFLNGRFISDRRIAYAVREAFRGLVEHDRFPVVFIFLAADPRDYDVNVHPTKIEVRWKDAGLVQSQVLAVLRETLLSHDLTPSMNLDRAGRWNAARPGGVSDIIGGARDGDQARARQALADYLKRVDPTQARLTFRPPPFRSDALRPSIAGALRAPTGKPFPHDDEESRSLDRYSGAPSADAGNSPDSIESDGFAGLKSDGTSHEAESASIGASIHQSCAGGVFDVAGALPSGVMQIHNTYLVAQTDDGVIIIDQHALHERILYERFRERVLQGPLESQGMLMPVPIAASPARSESAEHFRPLLEKLGIDVRAFGPDALAVQAFPTLLKNVDIAAFVADLLDRLAECGEAASDETAIHAALDMMACKAAVKAGDALTLDEMHALLEMRHLTERSSNCPHGRPTTLELTTRDLEKQFKRI